jgi:hypothetical protein
MPLQPIVKPRGHSRKVATARNNAMMPVPTPLGGLNFRDTYMTMPATDATVLQNVICRANGVELRGGWREHVTGLSVGDSTTVNAVAAYAAANPIDDRLFAFVADRIFDATNSADNPSPMQTVTGASADWNFVQFQNGNVNYLCAVNRGGGYWTYDSTNGWVNRTSNLTSGPPNITQITSIAVWKKRLWFTFSGRSTAYYLPLDSVQGALSPFDFGAQLKHGGEIVGIDTFTQDGGLDITDNMVVFGSEGDIIVYGGYDPSNAANFQLIGAWKVGRFPKGSNFWRKVGTDIYAVCDQGLVSLSMLVGGRWTDSVISNPITGKIAPAIGPAVTWNRGNGADTWQIHHFAPLDILIVKEPKTVDGYWRQWVMNVSTAAWSTFDGVPILSSTIWRSQFVFGTDDGRVCFAFTEDEETDGETRLGVAGGTIEGDIQGAFYDYGQPGVLKCFQLVRTIINATDTPNVAIRLNTQFTFDTISGSPGYVPPSGAKWDQSQWNQANWAGSSNTFEAWTGLSGVGYYGALRVGLRGLPRTKYAGSIINIQPGGPM